ncbi:MAG: peptidase domain protein [Sphingomonas bacterium]|uniref:M16 family metallopeptidase n=1 Tax=Sphingomonas bacterium TaxID=1895847 RepID=UPI0026237026|nr:M16 family metallopeptidase [Sphingomonas bacterium]MDB5702990.1 peptidase domain protein [Sphingomonas bacterium]
MFSPRRLLLLVTASSMGLLAVAPVLGRSAAPTAVAAKTPPSQPWPQATSDVPADSAVRFGTLPNGMRYAILHNATPPGQTSLRLRIDAGSLMEKGDQLGLAHFMEHMAFNGTTHIPKNELISILQRLGLAFGADLNAGTSFDQTYYQLELPRSNDETIDTGLHVMREQVSEATIAQQDIVNERGVIAGEERLRNSPALRVSRAQINIYAKGQKVADRFPIGDLKIINTAPRDRFVDFYHSYYRPSRATLIAVGDFDVSAMEGKILKAFGDWQPSAPDGPDPDLGTVAAHASETHVTVEPGVSSSVSLAWTSAPDLTPDSIAKQRRDLIESLGIAVMNRRLGELSRTDAAPFLSAGASESSLMRSVRIATVSALYVQGKWQRALEAIDQEQRQLVQYGVSDAELQREIITYRTALENAVKAAPTRNTRALAVGLLTAVNQREVFTAPQTDLDLFEQIVKGLTPAAVNAALKPIFTGGGPLTMVVSPVAIDGGEPAVAAAFLKSRQLPVAVPAALAKLAWPYTDFGKPGTVRSRQEVAELGTTIITFANGVTVTVKPTSFSKNSVSIGLLTGTGEQNFSPDQLDPRAATIGGLQSGGLGKLTVDEMSRSLNGHMVGAGLATLGDKFLLSGGTRREDLQLEMQVMAAYLTDPAYRSTAFEQAKANYPAMYEATLAQPAGAFSIQAKELLAGGDKRAGVIPPDILAQWSMDAVRPDLKALLSNGPIHITMVGDLTVDEAIAVTANTFGALPPRPAASQPAPGADQRRFPAATAVPLRFVHKGLAEQGFGYIAWPATDTMRDLGGARRIELLTAVLKLRVYDEIRERLALAYSPGVSASYSDTYKGYGAISVEAETAPEKLPAFFTAMDSVAQKLRDAPISEDELKRAREPLVEAAKRAQNTNGWWLGKLTYIIDRPYYVPQTLTGIRDLEAVTPADIQALARKYLKPDVAWKAEVVPAAEPAKAG